MLESEPFTTRVAVPLWQPVLKHALLARLLLTSQLIRPFLRYGELWCEPCTSRGVRSTIQSREAAKKNDALSSILVFAAEWKKWYRVLRYRNGFGLLDSVRFGLWLARGGTEATRSGAPRDEVLQCLKDY